MLSDGTSRKLPTFGQNRELLVDDGGEVGKGVITGFQGQAEEPREVPTQGAREVVSRQEADGPEAREAVGPCSREP